MLKTIPVEVEPEIFRWLRTSSGWTVEDVARKLKTSEKVIVSIESGERKPTLKQLKDLSKAYKRPLATFLLSKPLQEEPRPKDYRMIPGKEGVFDKRTIYILRKVRELQDVGSELLKNIFDSSLSKIDHFSLASNPEELGSNLRKEFELSFKDQKRFKDSSSFFNFLRDRIENNNVLVFQFSMPIDDVRGFALTDEHPYVIVVNSSDSVEARIFTLMHEYAHLLLEQTTIDLPERSILTNDIVERWCNSFASEFLLPKEDALGIFDEVRADIDSTETLNRISRRLKLSKAMICYRMLKLGYIDEGRYEAIIDRFRPDRIPVPEEEDEEGEVRKGGIPAEVKVLSEMGNRFVNIVAENYEHNNITYTDALNYLSVRSHNFDRVMARARP